MKVNGYEIKPYADLSCANLRNADLSGADLRDADLRNADLRNAILRNADLRNADLSGADLSGADLRNAILRNADLSKTYLYGADLSCANLSGADLSKTYLYGADLSGADLSCANLRNVDLSKTDLTDIKTNYLTIGYELACPSIGSFIGYKKASDYIVKLQILEDSKRCSATTRKCRCDKALVLDIYKGEIHIDSVPSSWDNNFIYKVGEIVQVDDYEENRWNECASGINFFVSENDAITYPTI